MTAFQEQQSLVVVTGASSGIGAATARELAKQGFHVLAGVRREQDAAAIRSDSIEPLILDITRPEHIRGMVERVEADERGRALAAVVNNAGVPVNVPVEVFKLDEWRRLFEVNLFGHVAVTQALLPALFRSKGRVVNISSVGGKVAMATYGPYAGTKFALEAVSDALRREAAPCGVSVVVIEPGGVRTAMLGRAAATARDIAPSMTEEQQGRYGQLIHAVAAQTEHAAKWSVPPETVAGVIAKAVSVRRPRARYTVGRDAAFVTLLARLLPDRLLDRVFGAALRPHMAKAA